MTRNCLEDVLCRATAAQERGVVEIHGVEGVGVGVWCVELEIHHCIQDH